MSTLVSIPQAEWKGFFELMSRALVGARAEIEVASLDIGDQVVAEWLPLVGITYDDRNDLLDVALDRMNYLIRHPREIVVSQLPLSVTSVGVLDAEGAEETIRLREPLRLPPG